MNTDETPQAPHTSGETDQPRAIPESAETVSNAAELASESIQTGAEGEQPANGESSLASDNSADAAPEDEPFAQAYYAEQQGEDDFIGGDIDIDAALAAVAALSDVAAQREAVEDASLATSKQPRSGAPRFLPPEPIRLKRGSPASVVPAMVLIVTGALLTLMTTSGTPLPPTWIAGGVVGAVVLLFLGYWLSARRWARGAFYFAVLLLLSSAAVYLITTGDAFGTAGVPLIVSATGLALLLTALLTRPAMRALLVPAFVLMLAGLAAFGVTSGMVDRSLLTLAAQYAWVVPLVLAAIWLLPFVFRRRS